MSNGRKVAIIGSGLIGRSMTMIFTSFGFEVKIYDVQKESLQKIPELVRKELSELIENKVARGTLSLEERLKLITLCDSLEECLDGVEHIQECVYDSLSLKQDVFEQVDRILAENNTDTIISSSTSIHMPSKVYAKVKKHKDQCLVAHPTNPPLYVKLIELVPCVETRKDIMVRSRALWEQIEQKPVVLFKEIYGLGLNRVQYAIILESYRLIHEGIMSAEDVDIMMSEGLGPRYGFMGQWMIAHLDAPYGMKDYLERYNEGIYDVCKTFTPILKMGGKPAQEIVDMLEKHVPVDELPKKREWRDKCYIELLKIKQKLGHSIP